MLKIKQALLTILFFTNILFANIELDVELTQEEKQWIKHNTISIGVENWEPLIYFNKKNEIDGITGDLLKLIQERLNLKLKIVGNKWDFLLSEFKKGNIDVLPATYHTDERATYGRYSTSYFSIKEYIYLRNDNDIVKDFEHLSGRKIAIIRDYGTIPKIRKKYPNIQIVETDDMAESVKFVLEGKVDALVDAQLGIENFISDNYIVGLKGISQDSFKSSPIYFFSNIKKPILQSILQKGLNSVSKAERTLIVNKWLHKDKNNEFDYVFASKLLAIIFVISAFFLYRNKQLEKHNKTLKELNNTLEDKIQKAVDNSTRTMTLENKKLQELNNNFQDIFNSTMEMILFCDENKIITEVNNSCIKVLGYDSKSDIVGMHILKLVPSHQISIAEESMNNEFLLPSELTIYNKNNELISTLINAKNIVRNGKKARMITLIDISEVKQQQKILQQQARLAQMGEMISMIAHQWRQPLGAISSSVIGIQSKLAIGKFDLSVQDDRDKFLNFLDKKNNNISEYVKSLSETIDDFRNFFKPDKQKELVNISEPINKALKIVETTMRSKGIQINLICGLSCDLSIYQNELMQVILNILKNSEDNFTERNTINPQIDIKTLKDYNSYDNTCMIEIHDNGGGIDESIMSNIFDPYFSTKDEKNGTGLGLYMSKIIIEEHHNGKFNVRNTSKGVCFTMTIKA